MNETETCFVGKEANELERDEVGLVEELEEVLIIYERDRLESLPDRLKGMTVKEAMELTGCSRRQVFNLRSGRR